MNNPYQVKGRGFGITGSDLGNQFLSDFQDVTAPLTGAYSSWTNNLTPNNSTNTLGTNAGSAQDWYSAPIPDTPQLFGQSLGNVQQGYGLTPQDVANYKAIPANAAGIAGADWTTAPLVYNNATGADKVLPNPEGGIGVVSANGSSYGWDSLKGDVGDAWNSVDGFVNNTLGGWGNVFQGIQALGNMYGGFKQLGMMQDQLDLARDSFNFNKAITTQNLANQVKSYNTSLADRYRARAFTETGNANAYDKQIEERKLDSKI